MYIETTPLTLYIWYVTQIYLTTIHWYFILMYVLILAAILFIYVYSNYTMCPKSFIFYTKMCLSAIYINKNNVTETNVLNLVAVSCVFLFMPIASKSSIMPCRYSLWLICPNNKGHPKQLDRVVVISGIVIHVQHFWSHHWLYQVYMWHILAYFLNLCTSNNLLRGIYVAFKAYVYCMNIMAIAW